MLLLRLLLFLAIIAILTLFALQNWAISMSVVFLGLKSPAFPLSLWILAAIGLGVSTTLLLSTLVGLTAFSARRSQRRKNSAPNSNPGDTRFSTATKANSYTATQPNSARRSAPPEDDASDWFEDDDDDWDEQPYDRPKDRPRDQSSAPAASPSRVSASPQSSPQSVVDADYRVITPPQRRLDEEELR